MAQILRLVIVVLVLKTAASDNSLDPLSNEFIEFINTNQSLWRAGRNFNQDIPSSYIELLAGTIRADATNEKKNLDENPPYKSEDEPLPENFDSRVRWPNCPSLNTVRDQGSCGSCWAVAAAAAMTDRFCIASEGKETFNFASGDILSCCMTCGPGCAGGKLPAAWKFYKRKGIVSGGEYDSKQGCQPYKIPPCDHRVAENLLPCGHNVKTPVCENKCDGNYQHSYGSDKKKGKKVYPVENEKVLRDIYERGPVTTSFDFYEDLLQYKSGIYRHVAGKLVGGHSVKLMGWGVEQGVKYWLAANTWNGEWGDKGFFKILRDVNHCGIEDAIIAGI